MSFVLETGRGAKRMVHRSSIRQCWMQRRNVPPPCREELHRGSLRPRGARGGGGLAAQLEEWGARVLVYEQSWKGFWHTGGPPFSESKLHSPHRPYSSNEIFRYPHHS